MSFKLTDFITVSNTGNVGIGTSSIEGKLTLNHTAAELPSSGTTSNSAIQIISSLNNQLNIGLNTVSGDYGSYIQSSDNNLAVPYPLFLQPNGGNIGIGTLSPTNLSSQTSLTIQGASVSRLDLLGASGAGGGVVFGTSTAFTVQGNYGVPLVLDAGTTADMNFNIGGSTKLTISSGGDATFGSKLDITTSVSGFASTITNNKDDSQGLLVRTSDNDGGEYILDLQSSTSSTGTDYSSKFNVAKGGNATFTGLINANQGVAVVDTTAGSAGTPQFKTLLSYQYSNVNALSTIKGGNEASGTNGTYLKFYVNSKDAVNTPLNLLTLQSSFVNGTNANFNCDVEVVKSSTPTIQLTQSGTTNYKGYIKLAGNDLEIRGSSGVMEFYNGSVDGNSSALAMSISSGGAANFVSDVYQRSTLLTTDGTTANYRWQTYNNASDDAYVINSRNVGDVFKIGYTTGQAAFSSPNTTANVAMVTIRSTDSQGADVGGTIGLGGSYGAGLVNYALIRGAKENSTNNDSNGYMSFTVHSSAGEVERMRIASGGNVGIGTASPSTTLDVVSNTSSQYAARIINASTQSSTTAPSINFAYSNGSTSYGMVMNKGSINSGYFIGCFSPTNAHVFQILYNGNVENLNNAYGQISDIKLKENIVDATPKLNDLLRVNIKNFNFIGNETKQIGVIAQELEEIFPSMIDEKTDTEDREVTDEEGNITTEIVDLGTVTKSVKYSVFTPMLIKAIQEQQAQIEELKSEIQLLKNN